MQESIMSRGSDMRSLWFLVIPITLLLIMACGGGGGASEDDQTATGADGSSQLGETSNSNGDQDYPSGPYGTAKGDIIQNHRFYEVGSDSWVDMKGFYKSGKLLLLNSSSGTCPSCKEEAQELVKIYEKYHTDCLEVLYTMFTDDNGLPPSIEWLKSYAAGMGISYPIAIDYTDPDTGTFQLSLYYAAEYVPMNMIIDTGTMKILHKQTGFSSGTLEGLIFQYCSDF